MNRENLPSLTWEQLTDSYQSKNHGCGSHHSYNPRLNKIIDLGCNQYSCKKCRPHLVTDLYEKTLQAMYSHDLQRHLVITFPGTQMRQTYDYITSYKLMNYDFIKFIQTIKYQLKKQGQLREDFAYIKYPRAQKKGYCHHHVILNNWIDKSLIDRTIANNNYHFGYSSINYNQDLADYLRDFKKDHEYYIPPHLKHYSSSRNIVLDPGQGYRGNPYNLTYTKLSYAELDQLILEKYNQIAPFDIYIKWFQDVINAPQKLLPGTYINGELTQPYIQKKRR